MTQVNKTYYCSITFWEPRAGICMVEAKDEEDARKQIHERLTIVKDLNIESISTEVPAELAQVREDEDTEEAQVIN